MTSGGPDERADCSIAKVLANIPYNDTAFNRAPPHFESAFALTLPFEIICPCYQHLPQNVRKMLPLLLAQLVHHYHSDTGIGSLGSDNPLHLSYLWSDPEGIQYRYFLFQNLRGFTYGRAELKTKFRDLKCDSWLMKVQLLANQTVLMRQGPRSRESDIALKASEELLYDVTDGRMDQSELVAGSNRGLSEQSSAPFDHQASTSILDSSDSARLPLPNSTHLPNAILRLPQAPSPFEVPEAMDVRTAWFRYHCLGADKQGLWRDKTARDINSSLCGKIRDKMREMLNKALAVCRMLQGQNSNDDVDQIGAAGSFQLCKAKVLSTWGCDILNDGLAAVRTVYLIMTGKSINAFSSLTMESCKLYRQQCQDSKWNNPAPLQQLFLRPLFGAQRNHVGDDRHSENDTVDNVGHSGIDDQQARNDALSLDNADIVVDTQSNERPLDENPTDASHDGSSPLSATECFVCAFCKPNRLFAKWPQYLNHYRSHFSDKRLHYLPERDEVQVAWGKKLHARANSQFVATSQSFWKSYSPETKLRFFRKRIISRKCLQTGDKIKVKYLESGECKVALVLDPALKYRQKAYYVASVRYLTKHEEIDRALELQEVPLTSILQHWRLQGTQATYSSTGRLDQLPSLTPIRRCNQHAASPINRVAGTAAQLISPIPPHEMNRSSVSPNTRPNFRQTVPSSLPEHENIQKSRGASAANSTLSTPGRSTRQQAASGATTQPQSFNTSADPRSHPELRQNLLSEFNAATSNRGGAAKALVVSARPTDGQSAVEFRATVKPAALSSCTINPSMQSSTRVRRMLHVDDRDIPIPALSLPALQHSDASPLAALSLPALQYSDASPSEFPLGVQIMLREISGPNKFIRVPHPHIKSTSNHTQRIGTSMGSANVSFPLFEYQGTQFVEEDFGIRFSRVYPAHIRQILSTFNLEESNRCFFITLGIATGYDPFMLQCLFRKHAALIRPELVGSGNLVAADQLGDLLANDGHVDCGVLNFCWPSEFSNLRMVYICTRGRQSHVVEFSEKPISCRTKDIFFRLHDGHFTLLTRIHNTFVPPQTSTITMLHQTNPTYRCPPVSSMQFAVFESESVYLSSPLVGNMPNTEQFNEMWRDASSQSGLHFHPDSFAWTDVPAAVQTKGTYMMGSMAPLSCKKVQHALLKTYFDTRFSRRVNQRSNLRAAQSPLKNVSASTEPCVFLDAGSESGHFLFRMMDHPSITHVAGVEIQEAWFDISVEIFKFIRSVCISQNFRMPAVTLFNSCMLSNNHQIKYLYSIANIVWQNNFVYHKEKFFSAEKKDRGTSRDVAVAPLSFMAKRDDRRYLLAANAAFFLGSHFRTSTCIAVHRPEYFNPVWNYHLMTEFDVKPTWGNSTAAVSILTHRQCISISASHRLLCVTQEEENAFENLLQKWSCALPSAYNIMDTTSLYLRQLVHFSRNHLSPRVTTTRAHPVNLDDDVESIDTRDLEKLFGDMLPQHFTKHALTIQDITSLQTTQVISDVVISAYVGLLKVQFAAHIHFPAGGAFFDMTFFENHLRDSKGAQQDNCRKYLTSRCGVIAFIVNTGYHWVAFKVDINKQYIAYVCSLQNSMEKEARLILNVLSCMHANAPSFRCFKVPAPHQQNAVDCGPLACMFLLFLTQNDITQATKLEYSSIPTAAEMRMRMFADVRQGKVTLLIDS